MELRGGIIRANELLLFVQVLRRLGLVAFRTVEADFRRWRSEILTPYECGGGVYLEPPLVTPPSLLPLTLVQRRAQVYALAYPPATLITLCLEYPRRLFLPCPQYVCILSRGTLSCHTS